MRRLLIERPLQVPDARLRARVLSAVARRRLEPAAQLAATSTLLGDVAAAANALDVVFEVVDVQASRLGLEAAGAFARGVAAGPALELAEALLKDGSTQWEGEPTEQEVVAATAIHAVASAGMVLASVRAGDRRQARAWLKRTEARARLAKSSSSIADVSAAIAKYVDTARAALDRAVADDDPDVVPAVAWLLWEWGLHAQAVKYAQLALGALRGLGMGPGTGTQIVTVEALERRQGLIAAAIASLGAVLAMDAAERGLTDQAEAAAEAMAGVTSAYGWLALTLAERAEINARLAVGLQHSGDLEAAREQLGQATVSAGDLARRGELAPFRRLCQALLSVLPPEEATSVWLDWLLAAAESGANDALVLVADYVRWLPEADLAGVVVDAETGRLLSA